MIQAWVIEKGELENIAASYFEVPSKRGVYFTDFDVTNLGVIEPTQKKSLDYFHHCVREDNGRVESGEIPGVISALIADQVLPTGNYIVTW